LGHILDLVEEAIQELRVFGCLQFGRKVRDGGLGLVQFPGQSPGLFSEVIDLLFRFAGFVPSDL